LAEGRAKSHPGNTVILKGRHLTHAFLSAVLFTAPGTVLPDDSNGGGITLNKKVEIICLEWHMTDYGVKRRK